MPKFKEQGIAHVLVLFILLIGIVGGVYLVTHPTIFRPKATDNQTRIEFVDSSGNSITATGSTNVKLKLTYVVVSATPTQASNPTPIPTPTLTPTLAPTPSPTPTPILSSSTPTPIPRIITSTSRARVFVTSYAYPANLSGTFGADSLCQSDANRARIGGLWKAWISDSTTSVASRFIHSTGPYTLLNGQDIASNWTQLTSGHLQSAINITENRTAVNTEGVWTNTKADGTVDSADTNLNCNNWTTTSSLLSGNGGLNNISDAGWTDSSAVQPCNKNGGNHLYCFEQVTDVQGVSSAYAQSASYPTHFRVANSEDELDSAEEQNFDMNGKIIDWTLPGSSGQKTVIAQFKVDNIWEDPVSATITLTSSSGATPSPTSAANTTPTPTPTSNAAATPTPIPSPTSTATASATPTLTLRPSSTPTPTSRSTFTPAPTPTPIRLTAIPTSIPVVTSNNPVVVQPQIIRQVVVAPTSSPIPTPQTDTLENVRKFPIFGGPISFLATTIINFLTFWKNL